MRILVTSFSMCILSVVALSQNTVLRWQTFDMGFAISTSGNIAAKSAAGQVFVGTMQQGNTRIESGFLVDSLLRSPIVNVSESEGVPSIFALNQNYPNPFNPSTTIRYELPQKSMVELHLYNIVGQRVAVLVQDEQEAGRYQVVWNGRNDFGLQVASGVYIYRLIARDRSSESNATFVETKKLILLR